jgi:hypothetical protein
MSPNPRLPSEMTPADRQRLLLLVRAEGPVKLLLVIADSLSIAASEQGGRGDRLGALALWDEHETVMDVARRLAADRRRKQGA